VPRLRVWVFEIRAWRVLFGQVRGLSGCGSPDKTAQVRLDDPFHDRARFGPAGQFTQCCCCGLTFESRGLGLCPDCYLVLGDPAERKTPSAASRPVRKQVCRSCGGDLPAYLPSGRKVRQSVTFCSSRCRLRAHREQRGSVFETDSRPPATLLPETGLSGAQSHENAVPAELAAQGVAGPNGSFDHV
jgi:hypothetical protein